MYQLKSAPVYRRTFHGSTELFKACWRRYRLLLQDAIDAPLCDADVIDWLDQIATEKVNTPGRFYIYG